MPVDGNATRAWCALRGGFSGSGVTVVRVRPRCGSGYFSLMLLAESALLFFLQKPSALRQPAMVCSVVLEEGIARRGVTMACSEAQG
jgi:hypothetical protein